MGVLKNAIGLNAGRAGIKPEPGQGRCRPGEHAEPANRRTGVDEQALGADRDVDHELERAGLGEVQDRLQLRRPALPDSGEAGLIDGTPHFDALA